MAVQKVGDRNKKEWSFKDIAFTLCSNAQSKEQKVIEIYEKDGSIRGIQDKG